MSNKDKILEILRNYPFLTYGTVKDTEYIGIVAKADNQFVSMCMIDLISTADDRKEFLQFGNDWWWGSNRKIPINVFIKDDSFKKYRECLRMFSAKDFTHVEGPMVSLAESINRRIRKRQITLVRKMD